MSPLQIRMDIDRRNRFGFLTMLAQEKMLMGAPALCDKIINDFLASAQNKVDPATNVRQISKRYGWAIVDITYLALPLSRISDVKDPSARLPPSQHPRISASLLLACSAARDVMATLQILSAHFLSTEYDMPQARDIASHFSTANINNCMAMMEQLAEEGNADCMTMQGRFLEKSGRKSEAKALYRRALETASLKVHRAWPHPMALPWVPPWRALPTLLLSDQNPTPEARAEAKAALEKGAFKADDPLAFYQLASFEDKKSPIWLKCMSKAAASGHLEATYQLGHFYMDVSSDSKTFLRSTKFKKALKFATSFKEGSVKLLAREWFEVAASGGHKPAMFELVKLYDDCGDRKSASEYLRRIMEPPPAGKAEEWQLVVEEAKKSLANRKLVRAKPV
ncbi:hypothetical protein P280DRAFT_413790 [Massarina eburnea CBS 473.64]|uniref:HCP-like protein n=1 Tax=Massarina eburnea CBS 473.64 TaxID=1395130 RepID=A0A6A6RHI0_9PLEO|nr:hypothetical protein P280DRAFT_413790 [Massarina eburnea CBS 473.64]